MIRYLRLYAHFVRFSFSRAMEFRLDFFFRVVMDAFWYAVNLAFFELLYLHTGMLGGWNHDQALVFIAGVFFADALHMTIYSNNMWWLPILVNRGDLDYYLVRPVSSLFFLSLREFAANSFLNLVMAAGILAWALLRWPAEPGATAIAGYILLLGLGTVIHYVLYMLCIIPVFWMHTGGSLQELFHIFDRLMSRPHGIYRGWVRRIVVSVLPFALIASFPAAALFEGFPAPLLVHMFAVVVVAFVVMLGFWRLALRSYASASS